MIATVDPHPAPLRSATLPLRGEGWSKWHRLTSFGCCRSRFAPHVARDADDEAQLGDLLFHTHGLAADAAGEAALRAQGKLLERRVAAGLVDAAFEVVGALERTALGGDEAEYGHFALGQEAQ